MINEWIKDVLYILLISVFVDTFTCTLILNKFVKLAMGIIVIIVVITPIAKMLNSNPTSEIFEMINKINLFEKEYELKYKDYDYNDTYLKYALLQYEDEIIAKIGNIMYQYGYIVNKVNVVTDKKITDIEKIKIVVRKENESDIKEKGSEYKIYKRKIDEAEIKKEIGRFINIPEEKLEIYG